jgi:hypothetical protein
LWLGILVTVVAGLIMGTSPWPLKLLRQFQYEHFAFVSMLVALVILPWTITLAFCPQPFAALREVDGGVLLKANLFEFAWGIAQVLAMLCFVRIGVSLTYGILCSIGAAVGVVVPMTIKASGVFQDAWGVLAAHPGEIGLSVIYGVLFFAPSALLGEGMLLLGPLGASVGWGLVQGSVILGQILGFASGEWRGVGGTPRKRMYLAVVLLIAAMAIMACAKAV